MADRVPSRCFLLGRLVLTTIRDAQRRREIEGDLIELWRRRAAAGRRDLRRAYFRDLVGVLLVGAASLAHRMQQAISTSSSGGFAMWQDIRYALRLMGRRPAPTIAAVATLAVGIGAGLAIFTAVDRLLLRPLPFPDPDHVVHVEHAPMRLGDDVGRMIDPAFVELPVIAAAGLWAPGGVNLDDGSGSARLEAAAVDDGFFRVMGVAPLVGRPLPPPDGSSRHAVLSYDTWRARFGADRSAIGGPIVLNGRTYIVTGVMPPGFTFPGRTAVWVPPGVDPQITGQAYTPALVARIASNVTLEQARAAITIYDATRGQTRDAEMALMPLGGELTSRARPTLLLLAASSGLLLLVVCASVANLLLAGVAMREQELTVRRALGASRWRVGRQLLIESLMLSGTGAVGGVLLAVWALQALRALTPPTLDPNLLAVGLLDVRFAVAAIGVTIATALIFGAAPGVAAGAREAAYVVRLGRHDVRSPFWRRFRSALIVGQMAIALILLMASAGAVRALVATTRIDAGFAGDSAVAMTVTLPFDRFRDPGSVTGFFERAHDRLMSLPAVRRVAATSYLPGATNEGGFGLELAVPGRVRPNDAPRFSATYLSASPDYFRTMGIRVVEGRPFTPADRAGTQAVLMLSESAARGLFPDGASPIGQRVTLSGSSTPHEVVGVVTDVHLRSLTTSERALRQAYVPLLQRPPFGNLSLVVEVDGDAADHIPALTAAMREVDPSIPVYNARPVEAIVAQYYAAHHLSGTLVSSFAAITLLVAAIGLYGLMAQLVAERVREIGIRLALGAQPSAVRRGIIRYGAAHALGGVVLGALGASAALQVFGAVLPGLDAPGVGTFVLNAGVLLLAALTAVWIPASRATRADPMSALRQ